MAVNVDLKLNLTATETLAGAGVSGTVSVPQTAFNHTTTLNSSSTPPATKSSYFAQALTAGAATVDLTSLPNISGTAAAVTFSGLKLQAIIWYNPSTNAAMTIAKGGSNGYGLTSGGGTFTISIPPGGRGIMFLDDEPPDVAGGAKNIDITGTLTESLYLGLVAG